MASDFSENMIIAGLDQDWAECVRVWDTLSPLERGELVAWLTGQHGDLRNAPDLIRCQVAAFASVAVLETGLRWSNRQQEDA